jgi:hypothetical protein
MRLAWATDLHLNFVSQVQILENLRVTTGPAEYGMPRIQEVIEVE